MISEPMPTPAPSDQNMTFPGLVSVVMPAWNEAQVMPELLSRIRAALKPIAGEIEILVIVPRPDDPTADAATQEGAQVIVQKRPGYGGALKEGLMAARGEYIITMDADLSHPPEAIPGIFALREKAEVIIGSRWVSGGSADMSTSRRLLSRILNAIYRRVLAVPVLDMSSGFRVYHREILDELALKSEKYDILEEILVKCYSLGWKVIEVPFDYQPRVAGESHASAIKFLPHFLSTLASLWLMRNTYDSADYDSRAYNSLVLPQRYWHRKRFQIVDDMVGRRDRLLHLGCGSSHFIQTHPDAVGLDIEIARLRFLRSTNRLLVRNDCFALPFADRSFETIVNTQVIEHVPYARSLFEEMNRVLEIDGTLVISTPDYGTLAWRIIERIYQWVLPYAYGDEHITHYSRYRLTEELAQVGFAIVGYRYIGWGELIMECVKRENCSISGSDKSA
jgi:dolichol-phosphate mannosyltransferase